MRKDPARARAANTKVRSRLASIQIIQVHMSPAGIRHDQIERVRWTEEGVRAVHETSRQSVARWVVNGGDSAYVGRGTTRVAVDVIRAAQPYLQAHDHGIWKDDLLGLPRY
jgi:hypothetical protein